MIRLAFSLLNVPRWYAGFHRQRLLWRPHDTNGASNVEISENHPFLSRAVQDLLCFLSRFLNWPRPIR